MDKQQVIDILKSNEFIEKCTRNIAEVICDIACNGKVVYPNESILVILFGYKGCCTDDSCADDQIITNKHWVICEGVQDFDEGIVYGAETAEKVYCKYYITNFKEVKPFTSDFETKEPKAKEINDYNNLLTSDLFQAVVEECSIDCVLDNAEDFIPESEIRNFLLACLGEDIK